MRGSPVWLASVSRQNRITRGPLATPSWSKPVMAESIGLLRRLLGPAGDASRERVFRMQVTVCLHRALSPVEIAGLPAYFETDPAVDLAGGPVEILEESEEGWETTKPCHTPTRIPLDPSNPLLWFPSDCGACPPCQARAALTADHDERIGAPPIYLAQTLAQAGVL